MRCAGGAPDPPPLRDVGRAGSGRVRGPTASKGGRVFGWSAPCPRCTACDGRAALQAAGWHMRERAKPRGRRSGRG